MFIPHASLYILPRTRRLLARSPELGWDVLGDDPQRIQSLQLLLLLL